ncbi:uncharacterized protein PGTG_03791 [Puccinia graminis f. sp. tritici CRL 75-36-700-3]|uniref:Bromo domain-containing protein n=1 Tax=Puccinia graminis f. sp. tritici (strain CRL 75-36-700-3 / race SCCL) TaxID=418459 RepID=E3K0L0_PUCGT|nr:uncharacterized protein PGTG_03791 [Puccinia graminis f. sp. tritici CRL 75-36-700-3]EFP77835.1 hypothetical protein PGTG_03791 [Puccinia graminis f. sp. tritici CRL 75-36-700-3]
MDLPSAVDYPDYYQFIKHPIALNLIKSQLDSEHNPYLSFDKLLSDLKLVFSNAKKYNVGDCDHKNEAEAPEPKRKKSKLELHPSQRTHPIPTPSTTPANGIKPTPPSTFVIPPTPVNPVSHNQRSAQTQPQPPKHLRSLAQLNQVALPLEEGDPKSDHFKVCGEYPTDLGDCPEGSPEFRLTRKQRRNCNRNQTKERQRLEDLRNHADLSNFSVHRLCSNQPLRLVQKNEIITKNKRVGGIVRFTKFSDIDPLLLHQFEALSQHLLEQSRYLNPNGNNGNKLGGTMFNAGWRKAYTHNEILGISASVPKISGHEERYLELQEEMKTQEKFLATRFAHLSRLLYDTLRIQHKELKLLFRATRLLFCISSQFHPQQLP